MPLLYKICTAREWTEARASGSYGGSSVDGADGFIHLSAGHQVRETARRHFAGIHGLVLVAFEADRLPGLRWEPSRGGDLFPHVYGEIATSLAVSVEALPLFETGHRFPEGFAP
jgi:uncharacterized protein (DUF952 family)